MRKGSTCNSCKSKLKDHGEIRRLNYHGNGRVSERTDLPMIHWRWKCPCGKTAVGYLTNTRDFV